MAMVRLDFSHYRIIFGSSTVTSCILISMVFDRIIVTRKWFIRYVHVHQIGTRHGLARKPENV